MEAIKAIYTTLDKLFNVKVAVPAMGAQWLVGVMDIITNEITPLGKGKEGVLAGLNYQVTSPEQLVIFTVGMVVKSNNGNSVIMNRTFSGLIAADFGKNANFTVEVKNKNIGEKNYTALSMNKAPGSYKYELKFSETEKPGQITDQKSYAIVGTQSQIIIVPTHQLQPAMQPA